MLQIGHLLDRKPSQLSGRPAPARRHGPRPRAPSAGLPLRRTALESRRQAASRHAHRDQARLHQRLRTTIVYVTHDQIEAMTLATKIAVLKDGLLQQSGTPARDLQQPANMFVADFMGSPAMNLLDATFETRGNAAAIVIGQREGQPPRSNCRQAHYRDGADRRSSSASGLRAITDPDARGSHVAAPRRGRLPDRGRGTGRVPTPMR